MKITNAILFFLIIFSGFLAYWIVNTEDIRKMTKLNKQYDGALTTAAQDAAVSLKVNSSPQTEFGYFSKNYSSINKSGSYETFMKTLGNNFGVIDTNKKHALQYYVPLYSIVEYDGFSVNRFQSVGSGNSKSLIRVWQPKLPYTYTDSSGNIFRFTLDDYVYVYDTFEDEWIEGTRKQLTIESQVALLNDEDKFDRIRRSSIIQTIEKQLNYEINLHNQITTTIGITYKFALPLITEEQWYNTIDDVGVLSSLQGYPLNRAGRTYNQFAFAGSRLVKNDEVYATIENGIPIFWNASCNFNYPQTEVYSSKGKAAKAGYREVSCLNK